MTTGTTMVVICTLSAFYFVDFVFAAIFGERKMFNSMHLYALNVKRS